MLNPQEQRLPWWGRRGPTGALDWPNETFTDLDIITDNPDIDFEFIARAGRLIDDPPEFAKSTPLLHTSQMVSLDTLLSLRTPYACSELPRVFSWCLDPAKPFQAPLPHESKARARCSSARRPNIGMGFAASLHHARPRVGWPGSFGCSG